MPSSTSPRARRLRVAGASMMIGLFVLALLPLSGAAGLLQVLDTQKTVGQVVDRVDRVARSTDTTVARVRHAVTASKPAPAAAAAPVTRRSQAKPRATDPQTQPALHGTNPHGQGSVAAIDLAPDNKRPTGGSPSGKDSGEDIVVGRARGEHTNGQNPHGHITIAALFGSEVLGVDTAPGETKAGPLDALQQGLLNPLCDGSAKQVCVTAVQADSATTAGGSTNKFSTAHATLGGANGIDVGAAESNGNIATDAQCQTTHGDSRVANVNAAGQAIASLAQSTSDSKACNNGTAPTQKNSSSVLGLGGTAVPLPAAGCGTGAPDTVTGIPILLPIVCNAEDSGSQAPAPSGVREALSVLALATGTTALTSITAASSETLAAAPAATTPTPPGGGTNGNGDTSNGNGSETPSGNGSGGPACSDGVDNDGDGVIDSKDPGCHSDGNASNPASYNPDDTSEANGTGNGAPQCSDGADNDGDGVIDSRDPGCHSDGNASNASSYVPSDDSEANGGKQLAALPFTGTNVLSTMIAGLLLVAGGLVVLRRRREQI